MSLKIYDKIWKRIKNVVSLHKKIATMKKNIKYLILLLLPLLGAQQVSARSFLTSSKVLVTSMAHDSKYLYVGTKKGLFIVDKEKRVPAFHDVRVKGGGSAVNAIALHDEDVWLGEANWRVANFSKATFESLYDKNGWWADIPSTEAGVTSLAFSSDGLRAAAVWDCLFVTDGQQTEAFCLERGLSEGAVEDILCDSEGAIWVVCSGNSTAPGTLCRYTREKGLETKGYATNGEDLASYCMAVDASDHVWLGTVWGALVEYDGQNFTLHENALGLTRVSAMSFDADGKLWLLAANAKGCSLVCYDGGIFTSLPLNMEEGESGDCLDIDGDTFYVGTNQRLLIVSNGQQASLALSENGTTGITAISGSPCAESRFDLQGRRVSRTPQGVYIQGGRLRVDGVQGTPSL